MDILAVVVPEVPMPLHPVPSVPRVGRAPRCRPALCAALVALALSSLLALVPAGPAGAAAGFPDVPVGHFAVTPITWGVEEGLTRGVGSTGLFMPDRDITRAELVTMLWRAEDQPSVGGTLPDDVAAGHFAAPAVRWALAEGVTTGATSFHPDRLITRAEIVTMLWRAEHRPSGASPLLPDVPADHFAAPAIRWALDRAVTTGVGTTGLFQPQRNLTRAEAITFVYRVAHLGTTGPTGPVGPPPVGPHTFSVGSSANPGRWNPCVPITWHVDTTNARYGNPGTVVPEVVRRLELYSGLDLVQVSDPDDADIRIRWGSLGGPAGVAQIRWWLMATPQIFEATVTIEQDFQVGSQDFGGPNSLGVTLLHEMAHAVGLGHVDADTHVMYPYIRPLTNYAVGDIYGLYRVGASSGCSFNAMPSLASADVPVGELTIVD